MRKPQAVKFWKALEDSTEFEPVLRKYSSKPGYGGRRTLERYAQAHKLFNSGSSLDEVAAKTGWSVAYVSKIYGWWQGWIGKTQDSGPKPQAGTAVTRGEAEESLELQLIGKEGAKGDLQPGPHIRELFYFGQRLRDRLSLDMPHYVLRENAETDPKALWHGRSANRSGDSPHDTEEENVDREWALDRCDARSHSLFPPFHQHLKDNRCWDLLAEAEKAFAAYEQACRIASERLQKEIKSRLPLASEEDLRNSATPLMVHGYLLAVGSAGLHFSYRADNSTDNSGRLRWSLAFGASKVGNEESPQALKPFEGTLRNLVDKTPRWEAILKLAEAASAAQERMESFQKALTPDALLRKLLLQGRCHLCP